MSAKTKRRNVRYVPALHPDISLELDAPASEPLVQELAAERMRVMSNYAYYDDDGLFLARPRSCT